MKPGFPTSLLALALCATCPPAQATDAIAHNDLDGDGRSDLIWRNDSTGKLVYWPAASASRSIDVAIVSRTGDTPVDFDLAQSTIVLACTLWSVSIADLVAANDKGDVIGMMASYGDPAGSYDAYRDSAVSADWRLVGAGDFTNSSYKQDLVFRNRRDGSNMIGFYDWDGRRLVPVTRVADLAWSIAGIGDFDGDGVSDLLWRHATTGRNAIWKSAQSATPLAVTGVTNLDWKIAAIGDFNGDQRSDILWRNARTGANVIWKSGNSLARQSVTGVTNLAWKVAAAGDFNGDGKWDLAWRNTSTGANVVWLSANAATPLRLTAVTNQAWKIVP